MCKCGCGKCDLKPVTLNENLKSRKVLSEGLKYHIDNSRPLTEHLYRAGSVEYFKLWQEARSLYSRETININNEDDLSILTETDLGHFATIDGKTVPLDFPIELNEQMDIYDDIANMEFGMDYDQLGDNEKEWVRDEIDNMEYSNESLKEAIVDYDFSKEELIRVIKQLKRGASTEVGMIKAFEKALGRELTDDEIRGFKLNEAKKKKKKGPKLNKPMRDSSGGKAYKVYVKDPKTGNIKTVRFGSGGLKAKINDPKARQAFAKRHKCSQKKDKTKASYWSCRLPRYAKQLGLKSNYTGYW